MILATTLIEIVDILEAVKPLCAARGILLTISDSIVEVGGRIYVKATATVEKDSKFKSCEAFAREAETKKGMDDAQVTGSASSYARKYALNGLFCIDDAKDPDSKENKIESRNKIDEGRAEMEEMAKDAIQNSNYSETKKKALLAGIPKHNDEFLRNIINGKV